MSETEEYPTEDSPEFKPYPDEPRWGGNGPTDANAPVVEADDADES